MPALTFPSHPAAGPVIEVIVKPSVLFQQANLNGQPCPEVILTLLLDTGASHCLVEEAAIRSLNARARTLQWIKSANKATVQGYAVDLSLSLFSGDRLHGAIPTCPSASSRPAISPAPFTKGGSDAMCSIAAFCTMTGPSSMCS